MVEARKTSNSQEVRNTLILGQHPAYNEILQESIVSFKVDVRAPCQVRCLLQKYSVWAEDFTDVDGDFLHDNSIFKRPYIISLHTYQFLGREDGVHHGDICS
jgi:hypothetical protein